MIRRLHPLQAAFGLTLLLRLLYPFYNNPLNHMMGLSKRQWNQAGSFWDPTYMAGVDSFLYQPWLAAIRYLTHDIPFLIQLYTGLLCAALPLCWYVCARQLLPARPALMVGLAIALTPSLWSIYAYFASETLLLPLLGLACAFSARCYQQPAPRWFFLAGLFWACAAFTRLIALPPALGCMLVLFWRMRWRPLPLLPVLAVWAALYSAAAWHSALAVGFKAAFGVPELNAILTRSDGAKIKVQFNGKDNWFRSPALSLEPFDPVSDWSMRGLKPATFVALDSRRGGAEWGHAMKSYPFRWEHYLERQVPHNTIFLLFGSSWPEVWPDAWGDDGHVIAWEESLNKHARWMWAPLIMFVFLFAMRYPMPVLQRGFIVMTLAVLITMMAQYTAVFEGRYRKPAEPMLLLSAALILHARARRDNHAT